MAYNIKVWDLPTRLFHWCLLLAVSYSWFSISILEDMQQHFYSGYVVLTLLLFRIVWGFVGSKYSRFASFFFPVSEYVNYVRTLFGQIESQRVGKQYLGHNPLGSLSALAILLALLVQAVLGLFSTDDYFFGPLAGVISSDLMGQLTSLHLDNVNLIYALLALHVVAIFYYQFGKKEPLTKAMITGNKRTETPSKEGERLASNLKALATLMACAALVYWLVTAYADVLPAASFDYY